MADLIDQCPSPEAVAHVRAAVETWTGDNRDLALALQSMGWSMLMILEGRADQLAMYEAAAKVLVTGGDAKGNA